MEDQGADPAVPPPAGWYPDPRTGNLRWWDGTQWGPVTASPTPPASATNPALSAVGHVSLFVFPVVVPLVLYLTTGKNDPDARHHAREALNFQITFLIAWFVGFGVAMLTMFGSARFLPDSGPPVSFVLVFLGMFAMYGTAIALSVYGAVQAGRGRRWRYPVSIRLVGRADSTASRTGP